MNIKTLALASCLLGVGGCYTVDTPIATPAVVAPAPSVLVTPPIVAPRVIVPAYRTWGYGPYWGYGPRFHHHHSRVRW